MTKEPVMLDWTFSIYDAEWTATSSVALLHDRGFQPEWWIGIRHDHGLFAVDLHHGHDSLLEEKKFFATLLEAKAFCQLEELRRTMR